VKPNKVQNIVLKGDKGEEQVEIPKELHNSNMIIRIKSGALQKSSPYYCHSIDLKVFQNYGQLRTLDAVTSKPLVGVYVKVYGRTYVGDTGTFYKDGYTDLRGRFDYVSKNEGNTSSINSFSILVLSDKNGAIIQEIQPPKK